MSTDETITSQLLQLANEFEQDLKDNILPFWIKYSFNHETGGFYGEVSATGIGKSSVHRGSLLCTRILWSFSSAYLSYKDASYLELADRAFIELEATFWDKTNGGVYWSVTGDGKSLGPHKQIYAQVFAIYGYSEYFRATGNEHALERAKTLYQLVEQHGLDNQHGGYIEWLSENWQPLPSEQENYLFVTSPKTQNTQLHVLEAYVNLLRAWPDAGLKRQLTALTEIMLTKVLNSKINHLRLLMDADWKEEGDTISFGHDIEGSWLLVDAAQVLQNEDLIKRTREVAVKLSDATIAEGVDATDGGIYQEASLSTGLTKTDKEWWPQAEALVGFLNAYEITGDSKYVEALKRSWNFTKSHIINYKTGEWHITLLTSTWPDEVPTIVEFKCPYHNTRAMLENTRRIRALVAKEIIS